MATGITKLEQHSEDAISVQNFEQDPAPLPPSNATARLIYPNKIEQSEVIQPIRRRFLAIENDDAVESKLIPDNSFILDDNFFVLNQMIHEGKKVDLYYLDPPYGTGFDFHSRELEHAYEDRMGSAAYIEFMRRRLILMRETMAESGSIYVHIGHHMLAHLKIVMDEVFGPSNFRNLITRRTCSSKNFTRNQYANLNDYILFYSKSKNYTWNQPGVKPDQDWIKKEYPKVDELGRRYKLVPIHAPGTRNGATGQPWRGKMPPAGKHWQYAPEKLEELDRQGDIHWSRNGNPRRKVYLTADKKIAMTDYWDQYRDAHHQSVKITGYPTEKNFDMVKMIVEASSDKGDLVVDPFCGSGTTLHAARDLGRRYIGMDASFTAAKTTLYRMRHGLKPMGDYVTRQAKPSAEVPLPIDIEPKAQPCGFVVDSALLEAYSQEIFEIAKS